MPHWVRCTTTSGTSNYVNLSAATNMIWDDKTKRTTIFFIGEEDGIRVTEKPTDLIRNVTNA